MAVAVGGAAVAAWRGEAAVGRGVAGIGVAGRVGLGTAVAVAGTGAAGRVAVGTRVAVAGGGVGRPAVGVGGGVGVAARFSS